MEKEALWYEKLEGDITHCLLCPHSCKIPEGKTGICKVRHNLKGVLYAKNYGKVSSIAIDPVEKKPLFHFHQGKYLLSIGTFGCNFKCDFCQNHQISQSDYFSQMLDIDKLIDICKNYPDCVGIAYTYNEPSIWYEFVLECAKKIKSKGLLNVLVTNGYINSEPLLELLPYIDAMNIDVKSMNPEFYTKICGGSLEPVIRTVEESINKCHVEITNLIIPELNDKSEDIRKLSKWLASLDPNTPLHLTRYYPSYKMKTSPTEPAKLSELKKEAEEYLNNVYIGNVPGLR